MDGHGTNLDGVIVHFCWCSNLSISSYSLNYSLYQFLFSDVFLINPWSSYLVMVGFVRASWGFHKVYEFLLSQLEIQTICIILVDDLAVWPVCACPSFIMVYTWEELYYYWLIVSAKHISEWVGVFFFDNYSRTR
jgi:hypothetical protein